MEARSIDRLTLYFQTEDREAAELIGAACEKSVALIQEHWGLATPADLRVYVMTSLLGFAAHGAPWSWRIPLLLTLPLWYPRQRKIWPYAGGYAQRYGRRRTVGVKPPRLMAASNRTVGERLFIQETSIEEKVQHTVCHELVHAFSDHLKLPVWLHEGLAMVTVDHFAGRPTVQPETLDLLVRSGAQSGARSYRQLSMEDRDGAVVLYARGYWLTRYLDDVQPGLIRGLLRAPESHDVLEAKIATALELGIEQFWDAVDDRVVARYGRDASAERAESEA